MDFHLEVFKQIGWYIGSHGDVSTGTQRERCSYGEVAACPPQVTITPHVGVARPSLAVRQSQRRFGVGWATLQAELSSASGWKALSTYNTDVRKRGVFSHVLGSILVGRTR